MIKVVYWVKCNDCGFTGFPSDTVNETRQKAQKFGWFVGISEDLCPDCAKDENRLKENPWRQ